MTAEDFLPADRRDLDSLRRAGAACTACDLHRRATQTVFGTGDPHARVLVVGEQPGDREDVTGEPFVGPAGQLLDRCLEDAGIDRRSLYVTNAVKHFKWEQRGKRRLHKTPSRTEVVACRPWVLAEIDAIGPEIVLCLGATAAKALLGNDFRVTQQRGRVLAGPDGMPVTATVHPSSILRVTDPAERRAEQKRFTADLGAVAAHLTG